ncbi:MAG TPA: hypothetical protein VGK74_05570 [Symbiobacteriaceae bacterium]|jgi:tetratricopeptide (TPR) repeat protein
MVEYLIKLMEEGEFQKCLRLAEQQLMRGGMSLSEMSQLNMVICRCRLGLQDSYGAIPSGLLAVKLARDIGEWDILGRALLNVGTAYVGARQYDEALQHFYSYFEHLNRYATAHRFEGAVWKSIGTAHQRKLETKLAIDAFERARRWFSRRGVDHSTFTCTHDLINTYLQAAERDPDFQLQPVADLLKEQKAIARSNSDDTFYRGTYLLDQASFYLHQNRVGRAMVSAMKAMEVRKGDHQLVFHSHMVLHRCNLTLGDMKQALGYALAARVEALQGRHYELEFLAAQAMADVIRREGTEVLQQLDAEYQALGVDLGQYLSPSILGRLN